MLAKSLDAVALPTEAQRLSPHQTGHIYSVCTEALARAWVVLEV